MKKNLKSLSSLSKEELMKESNELQKKFATLRIERYSKPVKNTREMREIRKKIAQMQTFVRQKELVV